MNRLPFWKPGDFIEGGFIVEEILQGAANRMYVVKHDRLTRKVLIKLPSLFALSDDILLSNFMGEADLRKSMGDHPNVVEYYFLKTIEGTPCIFMEFLDGGSLRDWIWEGRCIDYKVSLNLAIQFCHGMEFVHSKRIIHRDLKPENILMSKNGILKINDFNIAIRTHKNIFGFTRDFPKDLQIAGTPNYMAPEAAAALSSVSQRSDIFSFGICLYEMFCGNMPYRFSEVATQDPPDPKKLSRDGNFPTRLSHVLKKCVNRNPSERYFSFKDIRNEFEITYKELFKQESAYSRIYKTAPASDGSAFFEIIEREYDEKNIKPFDISNRSIFSNEKNNKQIEMIGAADEIDLSKYAWAPDKNVLAFLTADFMTHCEPLHTYLKIGSLWKCMTDGLVVRELDPKEYRDIAIYDHEKYTNGNKRYCRGLFGGVSGDAKSLKWSPDGKFLSVISNSGTELLVIEAENNSIRFYGSNDEIYDDLNWSPSSNHLALIGYRQGDKGKQFFVRILPNYENLGDCQLTICIEESRNWVLNSVIVTSNFVWSPSGKHFAVGGNDGFIIYNIHGDIIDEFGVKGVGWNGTEIRGWIQKNVMIANPYNLDVDYSFGDFIDLFPATGKFGIDFTLCFSDTLIAIFLSRCKNNFAFIQDNNVKIYKIDKAKEQSITKILLKNYPLSLKDIFIDWSPDSSRLLISSNGQSEFSLLDSDEEDEDRLDCDGIWVMETDNADPKLIAKGFHASWSYDGSLIAFLEKTGDGNCNNSEKASRRLCVIDAP